MTYEPGDLVLVPFPYTDLTAAKTRPALVLSTKSHNASGPDLVVCGLTSRLSNTAYSVLANPEDVDGRIPVASRIKVSKLLTIHHGLVRKRLGRLKPNIMRQVWKEFHSLFPA